MDDAQRPAADPMLRAATAPECQDGGLTLVVPGRLFRPGDRVLPVDEWIETGAQAGAAVVVDACAPHVRTRPDVRGLLTEEDLPARPRSGPPRPTVRRSAREPDGR